MLRFLYSAFPRFTGDDTLYCAAMNSQAVRDVFCGLTGLLSKDYLDRSGEQQFCLTIILILLRRCGPAAIPRLITSVIVNSIKRGISGTLAHIG
jgi:hypothetical protein